MTRPYEEPDALRRISEAIRQLLAERDPPVVVALDGGSGAGKSTLAALLAEEFNLAWIHVDDFFDASIPDTSWDGFSLPMRARRVFEWDRLRFDVIQPLLEGRQARWRSFDFQAGQRPDGTYPMRDDLFTCDPADVILLDGAYTAGPWLEDVVTLSILLDVAVSIRHRRLEERGEDADFLRAWHRRWDRVEEHYLTEIKPEDSFDLVVRNDQPRETA